MELELVSAGGDLVRIRLIGRVVRTDSVSDPDPLARVAGQDVYKNSVLLDLSESDYIDSSGLSWLLVCHKRFCEAGGQLLLHSLAPSVKETIRMMRLDLVLNVADDESAALELVRKAAS